MGLFKKKKNSGMKPDALRKMDKTPLKYVCERDPETAREIKIGENGAVNIMDGDFVIICGGNDVFRAPLGEVSVGELLNLSGFTASFTDKNGVRRTVIAYYTEGHISLKK